MALSIQPTNLDVQSLASIVIVVTSEEAAGELSSWLLKKPELYASNIVLVHIAEPKWLTKTPHSAAGGSHMLEDLQNQIFTMTNVLEKCTDTIRQQIPSLNIEYQVKTGDTLKLLAELTENIKADHLFIFRSNKITGLNLNFLKKNSLNTLREKCSCPLEIISTH